MMKWQRGSNLKLYTVLCKVVSTPANYTLLVLNGLKHTKTAVLCFNRNMNWFGLVQISVVMSCDG